MSSAIAALILGVLTAADVDPVLARLKPNVGVDEAKRACVSMSLEEVLWKRETDPQALADGAVKTKLLETLNRFELAPVDQTGSLDSSAFRDLFSARRGRRRYAAAFGAKGLRFLLVRIPVPVDASSDRERGDSRERLHPLRDALAEISRTVAPLTAASVNRGGNTYLWTGAHVHALYLPEEDELRVIVSASRDR